MALSVQDEDWSDGSGDREEKNIGIYAAGAN